MCQAQDDKLDTYFFVLKGDLPTGGAPMAAIYPVDSTKLEYTRILVHDRSGENCDLVGVNGRPGFPLTLSL